jgi:spore germination cell wall hydrolase CwlJ-like protein
MAVGILLCAFPSINTYATEEVTVNTEQVKATETETTEITEAAKVIGVASGIDTLETEKAVQEEKQTEETSQANEETKADDDMNKETSKADEKADAVKESKKTNDSNKKTVAKTREKKAVKKEEKKKKYSEADLRLLSAIIYCEAGSESYKGKVAVGIVVMNRVKSNLFPDTVKGVIYQSYQFTPARNGSLDRALNEYDKGNFTSEYEKDCIQAAKEVLSGKTTITLGGKVKDFRKYLFFSGSLKGNTFELGNHEFK